MRPGTRPDGRRADVRPNPTRDGRQRKPNQRRGEIRKKPGGINYRGQPTTMSIGPEMKTTRTMPAAMGDPTRPPWPGPTQTDSQEYDRGLGIGGDPHPQKTVRGRPHHPPQQIQQRGPPRTARDDAGLDLDARKEAREQQRPRRPG